MDFFEKTVHVAGTAIRKLGDMTTGMDDIHWLLLCVVAIGLGVASMRGKKVRGA